MVKIITDYGFCTGVSNAISKLKKTGKNYKRVYLTHPLLHNIPENNKLMKESNASFYEEGMTLDFSSAVVLSAHGHTKEESAIFDGICQIVDATCPLILSRYKDVIPYSDDISFFYLGKKNHQETKAFISNFSYFQLLDSTLITDEVLSDLQIKEKYVLIPQTTISKAIWNKVDSYLREKSHSVLTMDICPVYQRRFNQALQAFKDVDISKSYFIVCGDKTSSNANEIFDSVKQKYPSLEGCIALDIDSLDKELIKGKDIYIASATSVSKETVEQLVSSLTDSF